MLAWRLGGTLHHYRKLATRIAIAAAGITVIADLCAGCFAGNPVAETSNVKHLELQIAAFAHNHPSVAGVGDGVRCAVRVLGQSDQDAYIEALCGSTSKAWSSRDLGCVPREASEVDTAGVATLNSANMPVALRLDQRDDQAYQTWLDKNLPSEWSKYESHGPRFGDTLEARLKRSYGCGH